MIYNRFKDIETFNPHTYCMALDGNVNWSEISHQLSDRLFWHFKQMNLTDADDQLSFLTAP